MTSADYALDGSYAPKSKRNPIELVAIGILAVVVVVAVVLSIVVLVKVNDASSSTTTTPGQNQLNIPTQPVISSNSPQYAAYLDAVKQLKMAINFSADPCNDFWGYACGSYPSNQQFSFAAVDVNNYVIQANQMIKSQYQAPN
uniref:Peptidase M13 N-terminal domain-containing protein n=1 Tax=Plectus sambesii TaxID=2011161 RepID=A0A914XEP8_9BILA